MQEYHKIQTVYYRDPATKNKTLIEGKFSLPEFEYLKDCPWAFSEKVDGTNIRIGIDKEGKATFGGRTDNAQIPTFLLSRLQEITNLDPDVLRGFFPDGVTLYGEGYGPKIQKGGGNYGAEVDFVLFDVKVGDCWLLREDVEDIANKLGIYAVPILGTGTLADMVEIARAGFHSTWGTFRAEGIVARPAVPMFSRSGQRIITKIKCKDFSGPSGGQKR